MIRVVGREDKYDLISAYNRAQATRADEMTKLVLFTLNGIRTIGVLFGSAYLSFSAAVHTAEPIRQMIGDQPGSIATNIIAFGGAALGTLQASRTVMEQSLLDRAKPNPHYAHSLFQTLVMSYTLSAISVGVGIDSIRLDLEAAAARQKTSEQTRFEGNSLESQDGLSTHYSFSILK